jgi:hypothetical protein
MDLTSICGVFHPTTAALGTFSKIDHVWGHKEILSKYKKIEMAIME